MIYAVTGGAGFIGSHIARRLLRDGHRVRIIDNLLTGRRALVDALQDEFGDALTFYQASITDLDVLHHAFDDADTVFHLAALPSVPRSVNDPLETHVHCATGTLKVLLAARDIAVRRVVYAASSSAYGEIAGEYKVETMPPAPISPYGAAKLAGETYCQVFTTVYGLETVVLRYFNVFGPHQDPTSQYAAVIPRFISAMLRGQAPTIYGDGQQSRDFTYIDNVVHGNLLAADAVPAIGQVMNLATGGRVSLLDLVQKLNAILGTDIAPVHSAPRPGDILHSRADITRARALLGFEPVADFDEGLARTVDFYRQQMAAEGSA